MTDLNQTKYLRDLRRQMITLFTLDELKALAFDLSIDWDILSGEGKDTKVQSFIMHQARRGRLDDLTTLLRAERPAADWPTVPPPKQQIEDEGQITTGATRETTMQDYLHKMNTQVVSKRHPALGYSEGTLAIARAYTTALIPHLDKPRLVIVFRYLGEVGLSAIIMATDVDLSGADLNGVNLSESDLSNATLRKANLSGADLFQANLSGADLFGADLFRATLSWADLSFATLDGADLRESKMEHVNLSYAYLPDANVQDAYLYAADLTDATLTRADLSSTDLSWAILVRANLTEADLSSADLTGTSLLGANLTNANLSSANLSRANLSGTSLASPRSWTSREREMLSSARSLSRTIMPDEVALRGTFLDGPTFDEWEAQYSAKLNA